ncbi:MAG: CARDB domain-containing protein [Vicinamibacterales bacterium]|nr:CARDB domain-containing protein [Vicinamibacterales bacterium]
MRHARGTIVVAGLLAFMCLGDAPAPAVAGQVQMSPVDLVQTTLNAPGKVRIGKKFRIMDELESVGDSAASMSVTYFYLSKDDKVDDTDIVIAGRRVPPLPAGRVHQEFTTATIPATVEPGAYFLIVRANATRTVDERYLDNNTRATKIVVEPAEVKK